MTSVRDVTSQWLRARGLATVFVLLGMVGFAGHLAHALTAAVRDEANFFKPETVTQANEIITEIRQKYKKDLLVDTLRDVPAAERQQATSADPSVKGRFFADWAVRRAREEGVNGIYVLITRAPGHVEVAVGNTTRMVFPDEERHQLTQILLSHFKKKEYDEGLLEAVRFVRSTLAAQVEGQRGRAFSGPGVHHAAARATRRGRQCWLGPLALAMGWAWRSCSASGCFRRSSVPWPAPGRTNVWGICAGYGGPAGYGPAGGGGFFPSLLGGLFGAAAGSWLYDRFSGGQSPLAAEPPPSAPGPEDTGYTAEGGDFNSTDTSGGDFNADDSQGDDNSTGGDDDGGDFGGDDDTGGGF